MSRHHRWALININLIKTDNRLTVKKHQLDRWSLEEKIFKPMVQFYRKKCFVEDQMIDTIGSTYKAVRVPAKDCTSNCVCNTVSNDTIWSLEKASDQARVAQLADRLVGAGEALLLTV
jgi:hypothetical protein